MEDPEKVRTKGVLLNPRRADVPRIEPEAMRRIGMTRAVVMSRALEGLQAPEVHLEVQLGQRPG